VLHCGSRLGGHERRHQQTKMKHKNYTWKRNVRGDGQISKIFSTRRVRRDKAATMTTVETRDAATNQLEVQATGKQGKWSTLTTDNGSPVDSLTASMTAGER
jgi:hypothetical protein